MLPYFYIKSYNISQKSITLDEENSRHAIQVLRMKTGDSLHLTDGKGHLITGAIINNNKKHCEVSINAVVPQIKTGEDVTIAIALTKNAGRFEWFLEKAAELGVSEVIPVISKRTEKQRFKEDRLQNILISAMLQSQQTGLLQLQAPVDYNDFINAELYQSIPNKYIAHCINDNNKQLLKAARSPSLILIGPEGDFTSDEINDAISNGYQPVTLGGTRLRTETAGIVAATLLRVAH